MIKNDNEILRAGIITPTIGYLCRSNEGNPHQRAISWGISSFGYDVRLAPELKAFRLPSLHETAPIDPKDFDPSILVDLDLHTDLEKGQYFIMAPHSYALGRTMERFKLPKQLLGVCLGKSTPARAGLVVNTTPLEPEWEGYLTLELANVSPRPMRVYANEGIAQVLFLEGEPPAVTYNDRQGKYQGQGAEVVLPRV